MTLYQDIKAIADEYNIIEMPDGPPARRGGLYARDRWAQYAQVAALYADGDFVEIGARVGAFTVMLADVARDFGRRVVVVDLWGGPAIAQKKRFHRRVRKYRDIIDVVHASSFSKAAFEAVEDRNICFALVDGEHSHYAVLNDVRLVARAAVIAVDDINNRRARGSRRGWNALDYDFNYIERSTLREGVIVTRDIHERINDRPDNSDA